METRDIASAHGSAEAIIQRMVKDAIFAKRLRSDPRSTLVDAGLALEAVDDVIAHDLGMAIKPSQYRFASWDEPDTNVEW
jgi:hypothetical protein